MCHQLERMEGEEPDPCIFGLVLILSSNREVFGRGLWAWMHQGSVAGKATR